MSYQPPIEAPIDRVLGALRDRGYEPMTSGSGWACRCPSHDDRSPSLSLGVGDDGRALVHCHSPQCTTEEVLRSIGLQMSDLMPARSPGARSRRHVTATSASRSSSLAIGDGDGATKPPRRYPTVEAALAALERRHGAPTSAWNYTDAEGVLASVVGRWDCESGKKFLPASREGSEWTLKGMPVPRLIYALPEILASSSLVYVAEGEGSADAIRACGLTATTSPNGSKAAAKADWSPLSGRHVVVLPDNDEPGEQYATDVSNLAASAGAASVRIIRLLDHWPTLPETGDAADVLQMEGGDTAALRAGIESLTESAEREIIMSPASSMQFEPFPSDIFPEPIRSYVIESAASIGCDSSYVALPMLSALASAIGNTRRLALKRSWTEPPIIWSVIVGESGTAKSPAMELALRPVRSRQSRALKEHDAATKAWESEHARWEISLADWRKEAAKGDPGDPPPEPDRPVCARTWIDDVTIEALITRLQENPRGLLMVRDELAGWFNFDRYSSGKGASEAQRWLEVHGGRALIVDRKSTGTEYVPHAAVSIIGGIQPATLQRALGQDHRDNGLAARLLFAMPPRRPKRWTDDDLSEATDAAAADVFDSLYSLQADTDDEGNTVPRLVTLDAEASAAWIKFVNRHGAEQADRVGDEAAAWSKLESYCARFALVVHLARVAAGDPSIADPSLADVECIRAGARLVRWFSHEAERIYALLSGDAEARDQVQLLEWIRGRGGSITASQLAKGMRRYRNQSTAAAAALDELVTAGLGRWEHPAPGRKGGRPAKVFVTNSPPRIHPLSE